MNFSKTSDKQIFVNGLLVEKLTKSLEEMPDLLGLVKASRLVVTR